MQGTPCGIVNEAGRDCRDRAPHGSPLNLCPKHLRQAAELYASASDLTPSTRVRGACPSCGARALVAKVATRSIVCGMCGHTETVNPETIPRPDRTKITAGDPIVYYIQFGDRIKIGTTRSLPTRMASIPHDRVLAVERGDRDLEQERHRQFAHLRLSKRGEWFGLGDDLLAHIASLSEETRQLAH